MQSNDSIWRRHGQWQPGKDLTISLAKFGIQSFPEIGRVEAAHSIAFVISHKKVKRIEVLKFLFEQKVNVFQRGWSPVNIVPQENQLILWLEILANDLLRGLKVTMGIANENDPAGFQLYQL